MKNIRKATNTHQDPNQTVTSQLLKTHNGSKSEPLPPEKYRFWFSKRFSILILLCCQSALSSSLRYSINIVVVEMTTNKTVTIGNETIQQTFTRIYRLTTFFLWAADFDWDSETIGFVQGSYNYGFFFSAFGAYLATKFGGSVTNGATFAIASLLTALNPLSMQCGFYVFIICRIMIGLFEGFSYASNADIYSRWIPQKERSRFISIILSCGYFSIAATYSILGYVAYYCGWRMIFYVTGGCSLIWCIIWLIVARNQPSEDKFISKKELAYIISQAETTPREQIVHPYREIFTSAPVWAMGIARVTLIWGFFVIVACLPLYAKDVTQKNTGEIGVISSIPLIVCSFTAPLAGTVLDYVQNNTSLKPNQIHKMATAIGYTASSILFIVIAFSTSFPLSMVCFGLIQLCLTFDSLVLQLVCLSLAPKHSSVLMGIYAFWSVAGLVIMPSVVGFIIVNHSPQEWTICFLLTAGILIFGIIIYVVYGSSEVQPWATSTIRDIDEKLPENKKKAMIN